MEQMTEALKFLIEDAKIVVVALWVIGALLKNTPKVQNWLIPWVLMATSVILTSLTLGGFTIDNLNQAIIVAGIAIAGHQLFKQSKEGVTDAVSKKIEKGVAEIFKQKGEEDGEDNE